VGKVLSMGNSGKVQLGNPNWDESLSNLAEHVHHLVVLRFDKRTYIAANPMDDCTIQI
jgi:hypothetical protein